ncbi:hypothetical protein DSLASN_30270 [Desulfoluna limicola]|uniref:AMP-activated protein kinase glycogen-binding domain-containing protein n=1 Tax=Desulfoluna limicola TaxID=2810562 RepID=A0ABM7PJC5_9BACT|nr:glycogen-binding domain-containing protein [Desulfoluna limicola]BCS97395.1 hypothetical protein DSLASN_30270 [Desulfoluna limicola]
MESTLISQFIDDELTLDEKECFVIEIRHDEAVYGETLDLLAQERLLQRMDSHAPPAVTPRLQQRKTVWRPVVALAASLVLLLFSVMALVSDKDDHVTHRFLIHAPGVETVAVMGDFTAWNPVALSSVGGEGYWELTLDLSSGIHRYAFLINGEVLTLDPTVVARETDDFGGMNSILQIKKEA